MKEFKVIPHQSIGPAWLGMTRDEIRGVLGTPSCVEEAHVKWDIQFSNKDCFFNNTSQVSYDTDLKAEFIEASSEPDFTVTFDNVPVHESPPEKVLMAIGKHAEPDVTDSEYPVNQFFPDLGLSLYREQSEEGHFDAIGISTRDDRKKEKG
jgi:hypothetical protein